MDTCTPAPALTHSSIRFFEKRGTGIFEQLRVKDLISFSTSSKNCYDIITRYLDYVGQSREHWGDWEQHKTDWEQQKNILKNREFIVFYPKEIEYQLFINSAAITKTCIYFHSFWVMPQTNHKLGSAFFYPVNTVNCEIKKNNGNKQVTRLILGDEISKIIPCDDFLYIRMKNPLEKGGEKNAIQILTREGSGKKKVIKQINLCSTSRFLEVETKLGLLITDHKPGSIGIFNRLTAELITKIDFKVDIDDILGVKIINGYLYVRFMQGSIQLFDLKKLLSNPVQSIDGEKSYTKRIEGPMCKFSQPHFEIKGNYLYTAENFSVIKWKIPENSDEKLIKIGQINFFNEDQETKLSPYSFNFQIDGNILYLSLPNSSLKAFDCVTFETINLNLNFMPTGKKVDSKWKFSNFSANGGILVTSLYHDKRFRYIIADLNRKVEKSKKIGGDSVFYALKK